jgi:O-antigen ligase
MVGIGLAAIAIAPAVVAFWIWAVRNAERFFLFGVLGAMILAPIVLASPGGARVSAADVLLLVGLAGWLIGAAVGALPAPWVIANPLLAPTVCFVAVNVVSLAWSSDPSASLETIIQLAEIVLVIPLAFASIPKDLRTIRAGLLLFVALASVLAIITIALSIQQLAHGDIRAPQLGYGINKNAAGSYLAAGVVLAFAFMLRPGTELVMKRCLLVIFGIDAVATLLTFSRGSIIGAAIAIVVVSIALKRRRLVTIVAVLSTAVAFVAVFGIDPGADLSQRGSYTSRSVRVYSFDHAIDKIEAHPLLGTGTGTYSDYIPEIDITLPDPNNMLLLTWAELGIAGIAALLFLFIRYVLLWTALVRRLTGDAAVLGTGAAAVALSLFTHFQVDVTWTRGTTSLAFAALGIMLAVLRIATSQPESATRAPVPLRRWTE